MAVYYKFKSAKDYDSIPIDGHFISVATLKEKIYESKQLGRGTDYDLVVTNAQTNEEYLDEASLIPKNTSVLIRRLPGRPRNPIVTAPVNEQDEPKVEIESENVQPLKITVSGVDPSLSTYLDYSEYDEFGSDLYEIPEALPAQPSNLVPDAPPPSKVDEESKIKALIDTPALDWQRQAADGFGPGRGFGRGLGGRMGGRGFGRGGLDRKTPPPGYVCYRCKVPGHFIQHCPTNGDPNFDIKRVKPPTGIPKSMLMATPDGSYALPSGAVAVLKPNEAAFEKEIEGMPSTRSVGDLPPELRCPLCKEVMKDAVLTSKCCFKSFCDKCIRDHIIEKLMCVCGATNVLADDLLPNKTLRDTINRILELNTSSAEKSGSAFQVQDMESARCPQPKIPSPSFSAASKGEHAPAQVETSEMQSETLSIRETADHDRSLKAQPQVPPENGRAAKVPDVSEASHESKSAKEPAASRGTVRPADEEVQQKQFPVEAAKKKKKKKAHLSTAGEEMMWRASQDFATDGYGMPLGPSFSNPYWNSMQPGMDPFVGPYFGAPVPYMGYGLGPLDVPFGGVLPQDPFGAPTYPIPFAPPQRDLADFGMGMNFAPPIMSREEFEARKAELKRKREFERLGGRELIKDRELGRDMSSSRDDIPPMKSKAKSIAPPPRPPPPLPVDDHHAHRRRPDRLSPDRHSQGDTEPSRTSSKKRASRHDDDYEESHHRQHRHQGQRRAESSAPKPQSAPPAPDPKSSSTAAAVSASDRKSKPSVFSRISFPEEEAIAAAAAAGTKRKGSSSTLETSSVAVAMSAAGHRRDRGPPANGYHEAHHKASASVSRKSPAVIAADEGADYDSSDDDRHFKRRPSRYESSPVRERDRGSHSKHR